MGLATIDHTSTGECLATLDHTTLVYVKVSGYTRPYYSREGGCAWLH